MKQLKWILLAVAVPVIGFAVNPKVKRSDAKTSLNQTQEIAVEAYIYGYPAITMDFTKKVMTNVENPTGKLAPVGQFAHLRQFPTPQDREVTAPNADTLYSLAWLDLTNEPYVLSVPAANGRYFLLPMLSAWTDVFQVPGTRTTGDGAQTYLITGPGWNGQVPAGMVEYKSPTAMMWLLGRTYCTGTPQDYAEVHKFQDDLKLVPLSSWDKVYTPPKGQIDPMVDMKTPPRDQVNALTGKVYFTTLMQLMDKNPATAADQPLIQKMATIGLTPGQNFDFDSLPADVQQALNDAPAIAMQRIVGQRQQAGEMVNGWIYANKTGDYGTDYLQRAFITYFGLGANLRSDAIYPSTTLDQNGELLNGSNKYVIHFTTMPPVNGFWSLTMYDDNYFFVPNAINRFNFNSRDSFKRNPDGSVDFYIQNTSPGADKEANWLPAPTGNFNLMLRTYWPKPEMVDGTWRAPGVQKVN